MMNIDRPDRIRACLLGTAAIPARWLEALELRGTIERMAQELAAG